MFQHVGGLSVCMKGEQITVTIKLFRMPYKFIYIFKNVLRPTSRYILHDSDYAILVMEEKFLKTSLLF